MNQLMNNATKGIEELRKTWHVNVHYKEEIEYRNRWNGLVTDMERFLTLKYSTSQARNSENTPKSMDNINAIDPSLRKHLLDQQQVTTYAIKHRKNAGIPLELTLRTEAEGETCGNAQTALQETLKSMAGQKMERSFTDPANVQWNLTNAPAKAMVKGHAKNNSNMGIPRPRVGVSQKLFKNTSHKNLGDINPRQTVGMFADGEQGSQRLYQNIFPKKPTDTRASLSQTLNLEKGLQMVKDRGSKKLMRGHMNIIKSIGEYSIDHKRNERNLIQTCKNFRKGDLQDLNKGLEGLEDLVHNEKSKLDRKKPSKFKKNTD